MSILFSQNLHLQIVTQIIDPDCKAHISEQAFHSSVLFLVTVLWVEPRGLFTNRYKSREIRAKN